MYIDHDQYRTLCMHMYMHNGRIRLSAFMYMNMYVHAHVLHIYMMKRLRNN